MVWCAVTRGGGMHRKDPSTTTRSPAETDPKRPWILRQTLVIGLGVLALHLAGAFAAADRWVVGAITGLQAPPERQAAPLILAVDGASILRWGPPPWSAETWREIAEGLGTAGVAEAYLVDPWVTLLQAPVGEGAIPAPGAATIRVPRLLLPGADPSALPVALDPPEVPPLVAWPHQLHLPTDDDGVLRALTGTAAADDLFGPSAFCAWGPRCPDPHRALTLRVSGAAALPTLSLADVATGERLPDALELDRRTLLLGITEPWRAWRVHVGPRAAPVPWPEAVGHAIATARTAPSVPRPGPAIDLLLVLLALLLSLVLTRAERLVGTPSTLLAPPVFLGSLGVGVFALGWLVPPFSALLLAAAVPPLAAGFTSRRVARDFLRHVALLLLQDGFRYAWKDTRLHTPQAVASKLVILTRSYFPDCDAGYLHRDRRGRLQWIGGIGLEEPDLHPAHLHERTPPFRRARLDPDGARCDEVLAIPVRGRALAIREGRLVVGYWVITWLDTGFEPDAAALGHLAAWTARRLDLHGEAAHAGLRDRLLDRLESDAAQVQRLFSTASEERRRQVQALHAVDLPLLTADLAGSIQFVNRRMVELLEGMGLGAVETVAGLFGGLQRDGETRARLRRLFATGTPLEIRWRDDEGHSWSFRAQPVHRGAEAHAEGVLGYVVHARDLTSAEQLEEIRASVVDFASTRVRNALMVIVGYAGLLEKKAEAAGTADAKMLRTILRNSEDVATAMDELKALGDLEADADREVEVDLGQIVREQVREAQPIGAARGLDFTIEGPEVSLPVLAAPGRARDAVAHLLREACVAAAHGSTVRFRLEERPADTLCAVEWGGPGLDTAMQAAMRPERWHHDLTRLPPGLLPYARARETFPDLEVISAPGQGIVVRFTLRRTGRT